MDVPAWIGAIGGAAGGAAALYVGLRTKAIERMKANLQKEGAEHEIRFARLHERRILVIDELYVDLVRVEHALAQALVTPTEDAKKAASEALQTFMTYFREHRIWLDMKLEGLLDGLERRFIEVSVGSTTYKHDDPTVHREYLQSLIENWGAVKDELPAVRRGVEARFRELLGATEGERRSPAYCERAGRRGHRVISWSSTLKGRSPAAAAASWGGPAFRNVP